MTFDPGPMARPGSTIQPMHSSASARSLATELDALARDLPGPAAIAARRRAGELRLEALLLRDTDPAPRPAHLEADPAGVHDRG